MYCAFGIVRANSLDVKVLQLESNQELPYLIVEGELGMLCTKIEDGAVSMATRESMSRYTDVLCQVIKHATVISLRFGTIFEQEEEIHKALQKDKKTYLKYLAKLDNKIEVELKVWWKKESFRETMLKNKRLERWKKALEKGKGQGYDVVEFGKAIMDTADIERKEVEKSFLAMLCPLAVYTGPWAPHHFILCRASSYFRWRIE